MQCLYNVYTIRIEVEKLKVKKWWDFRKIDVHDMKNDIYDMTGNSISRKSLI